MQNGRIFGSPGRISEAILGWLLRVDQIKPVSIRLSVHSQKVSQMIPDDMPYGPIKVPWHWRLEILSFSKSISSAIFNGSWQMTADSLARGQYLNLIGPDFCCLPSFLYRMTLSLEEKWDVTFENIFLQSQWHLVQSVTLGKLFTLPLLLNSVIWYQCKQESPAVADKLARRLRKVCTVYVRAVGL